MKKKTKERSHASRPKRHLAQQKKTWHCGFACLALYVVFFLCLRANDHLPFYYLKTDEMDNMSSEVADDVLFDILDFGHQNLISIFLCENI